MTDDATRLRDFLKVLYKTSKNGLILGGPQLCFAELQAEMKRSLPNRRLLFWEPGQDDNLEDLLLTSLWPGCTVGLRLDERADIKLFRLLEELLSEGYFTSLGGPRRAPEGWYLLIHSIPGYMPFSQLITYQLRLSPAT